MVDNNISISSHFPKGKGVVVSTKMSREKVIDIASWVETRLQETSLDTKGMKTKRFR